MKNQESPAIEKLVPALNSGIRVLRYLSSQGESLGATKIARELNINSSTCFNILKTLMHERLVDFDESSKSYRIGLGLVEIAKGSLEQSSYVKLIAPHLKELSVKHQVTVTLWQKAKADRVVMIDIAESPSAMRVHLSIGQRLPTYVGALGRSLAACSGLSPSELRTAISATRWENGPSFESYLTEIGQTRDQGYAIDDGNYVKGITSIASAILNDIASPILAISAVGLTAQLDAQQKQNLGEDLRSRCSEISNAISGKNIPMHWIAR